MNNIFFRKKWLLSLFMIITLILETESNYVSEKPAKSEVGVLIYV